MRKIIGCLVLVVCAGYIHAQTGLLDLKQPGTKRDLNGFKVDPKWKCQEDNNCNDNPQVPNATICDHRPSPDGTVSTNCRTQSTSDDGPTAFFKKTICSFAPSQLHGHVNFDEVVTLGGDMQWDGQSDDFDFDLVLTTHKGLLDTKYNSAKGTIALELDSRETIRAFRPEGLTKWWKEFKRRNDDPALRATVAGLFDHQYADGAVAIGLLGVDCEHSCHSELHPIYALAVRASDSKPEKEHWIVLARNFGDEGFCSHRVHPLGTTGQFQTLHITIPKAAVDVAATGDFVRTKGATAAVGLTPIKGVGVDVAIPLTDPKARQVYLGEVWVTGSSQLPERAAAPVALTAEERTQELEGSETMLRSLIAQLPAKNQRAIHSLRSVAMMPVKSKASPQEAISIDQYAWNTAHRSSELRLMPEPDTDLVQEQNDLLLWKTICAAYKNKLPDERLRDACSPAALTISEER